MSTERSEKGFEFQTDWEIFNFNMFLRFQDIWLSWISIEGHVWLFNLKIRNMARLYFIHFNSYCPSHFGYSDHLVDTAVQPLQQCHQLG